MSFHAAAKAAPSVLEHHAAPPQHPAHPPHGRRDKSAAGDDPAASSASASTSLFAGASVVTSYGTTTDGDGGGAADPKQPVFARAAREPLSVAAAVRELLPIAAPAALAVVCDNLGQSVGLAFVGRYLTFHEIGAASIATSVIFGGMAFFLTGMLAALDTLVSHYMGADPDDPEIGVVFQRALAVNAGACAVTAVACFHLRPAFQWMYPPELAHLAAVYIETGGPLCVLFFTTSRACAKFLNNQELAHFPFLATATALASSFVWHPLLVPRFGLRGAAIAYALTFVVELSVLATCIWRSPQARRVLRGGASPGALRRALAFDGVREYLCLALPSAVFVAGEAAVFDLQPLLAGQFGSAQAAAFGVVFALSLISVSVPTGITTAVCAKVGAAIGDDRPADARRLSLVGLALSFGCAAVASAVVVLGSRPILEAFGGGHEVADAARVLLPLVPFFFCLDGLQFTFQGIFSALGRNHVGAGVLIGSLWAIGLPAMIILLNFRGLAGIMEGIIVGMLCEIPMMAYLLFYRLSWSTVVAMRSPTRPGEASA